MTRWAACAALGVLWWGCAVEGSGGERASASDASAAGAPDLAGSGSARAGAAAMMMDAGCAARGTCAGARAGSGGSGPARDAAPQRDPVTAPDGSRADAATGRDGGSADGGADAGDDDAVRDGWTLTFREEFDGAAGDGIDESHWTPVHKGDGFGNNELQFYTGRKENVRQDGEGSLVIEVRKESYMGRMYTSARLESSGKHEQQYGRFEIRAKLPFGQGIWPAFWTLGNDISSVSWPECGEIDIMEHVGRTPSTNYGSLHGPGYSGGNPLTGEYELPGGARFADDFHTYAVEWEEGVVRWYVDDHLYQTRTPADVPNGGRWVYDHPFFLILNVAVGGAFPGPPDDTTQFPQRMLVDYVRVYERTK